MNFSSTPRTRSAITATIACFAGLLVFVSSLRASEEDVNAEQALKLVIGGITNNYSRCPRIKASLRVVTVCPSLKEATVRTFTTPSGAIATMKSYPRREHNLDCILIGNDYLTTAVYPDRMYLYSRVGDEWTNYSVNKKMAWVFGRQHLPGTLPHDPRDIGLPDSRQSILEFLAMNDLQKATYLEDDKSSQGAEVQLTFRDSKSRLFELSFDAQTSFLPRAIAQIRADGTVVFETNLTYQELPSGGHFLREANQTFYEVISDHPMKSDVSQRIQWLVTSLAQISDPLDASIVQIKLPSDVRVANSITGTFTHGRPRDSSMNGTSRSWLIVANILGALVLIVLIVRSRVVHRKEH